MISGRVKVKSNVEYFVEIAAIFEDGSAVKNIDRSLLVCLGVFFATGYTFSSLFFDDYLNIIDDHVSLYHFVSSLLLEKLILAFIGLIQ